MDCHKVNLIGNSLISVKWFMWCKLIVFGCGKVWAGNGGKLRNFGISEKVNSLIVKQAEKEIIFCVIFKSVF